MKCPTCGTELMGLGRWCTVCERYTDEAATRAGSPTSDALPDDRSEAEIQRATREALAALGFFVCDLSQDRPTRQTPGIADLFVAGHGVTVWIEMKGPKGRQSQAQRAFERHVTENGGRYWICRHESEAIEWAQDVKRRAA